MRQGFTLLEMLLAVTLSSVLLAAGLDVAAGLSRDMAVMGRTGPGDVGAEMELIRHDLENALAIIEPTNHGGLLLVGHGGIDGKSLESRWRLVCTEYRVEQRGTARLLTRRQSYLDDSIRPEAWSEIVALNVKAFSVSPTGQELEPARLGEDVELRLRQTMGRGIELPAANAVRVPSRVRVRIEQSGRVRDQEMVLQ